MDGLEESIVEKREERGDEICIISQQNEEEKRCDLGCGGLKLYMGYG